MHSSLFVIEIPDLSHPGKNKNWLRMQYTLSETVNKYEGIEKLSENVLMLPLQSALPALGILIYAAQESKFSYQVLFLDEKPQWIYSK